MNPTNVDFEIFCNGADFNFFFFNAREAEGLFVRTAMR